MDYSKPTLFVISGPPGAGKSTFGSALLPEAFEGIKPFNRDSSITEEEKKKFADLQGDDLAYLSYLSMEKKLMDEMNNAIASKAHYALETPLHHTAYVEDYIKPFVDHGYQIELCYLCLDKVSACNARVQHRYKTGGHWLPPELIKEVYDDSPPLIDAHRNIFTAINLYDGTKEPKLIASFENGITTYLKPEALTKKWITEGMPEITKQLKQVLPPLKQKRGQQL